MGEIRKALFSDPLFLSVRESLGEVLPNKIFIFGRCITDFLFLKTPRGILLGCECDASKVVSNLCKSSDFREIPLRNRDIYHLYSKIHGGRKVTVVNIKEGIMGVLAGCGFSATAMAIDLGEPLLKLIDPFGGISSLNERKLRLTKKSALLLDPAKIFVGVELCASFGLSVSDETMLSIKDASCRLSSNITPRIWKAFSRILEAPDFTSSAKLLRNTGVLSRILPEIERIYGIPQNYYHHLGVWEHTIETISFLDDIFKETSNYFPAYGRRISKRLERSLDSGLSRKSFLLLAALLHDIGKAECMKVEPSGRIRFRGHHIAGERLVSGIARRLPIGNAGRMYLRDLVGNHMIFGFLLKRGETVKERLRAIFELGSNCPDVVLLSLADRLATRGEASTEEELERFRRLLSRVVADYFWCVETPQILDGADIIALKSGIGGKEIRENLFSIRVAQREGIISTLKEAVHFVAPEAGRNEY